MSASSNWWPVVVIDLETTGLQREDDDVVQIAASTLGAPSFSYDAYVVPAKGLSDFVTGLTGLAKKGDELLLRGQPLAAVSRRDAVQGFLDFLGAVRGARKEQLVLVAHNAFGFDAHHLIRWVAREGLLPRLAELVRGFTDTLPLFRQALTQRLLKATKGDFALGRLAEDYKVLDGIDALHNAVRDVEVLKRLVAKVDMHWSLLTCSARPLDSFSAYKQALNPGGLDGLVADVCALTLSDEELLRQLRSKLSVIKTLEKAAAKVTKKLPELVEHAGWTTNFYVGQLEEQGQSLESAREELQGLFSRDFDSSSVVEANEIADKAVAEADHMRDWLQLVAGDSKATWSMELERGGRVWKGTFQVSMYSEAGHPALYGLLADGVLKKVNPSKRSGSVKDLVALMVDLEGAARKIKGPLEQLFLYLEFYRNKQEEDLLEGGHQHITGTREQIEDVLKNHVANVEMQLDTMELVDDTLQRDQYLADWVALIGDPKVQVRMEVRRGGDAWKGAQAMKDFPYAAQVLLFDLMHGEKVTRQQ